MSIIGILATCITAYIFERAGQWKGFHKNLDRFMHKSGANSSETYRNWQLSLSVLDRDIYF